MIRSSTPSSWRSRRAAASRSGWLKSERNLALAAASNVSSSGRTARRIASSVAGSTSRLKSMASSNSLRIEARLAATPETPEAGTMTASLVQRNGSSTRWPRQRAMPRSTREAVSQRRSMALAMHAILRVWEK